MVGDFDLLNKILRYSIVNILIIPIYIFATESKRSQDQMLAIAILSISVVVTTYYWWEKVNFQPTIWKYIDRAVATSLVVLIFYYGDNISRGFTSLGILFYIMGMSDTFKESDSYLNHMLFRYFAGLGLIIYIADEPYKDIFIGISSLFTLYCLYYSVKDIRYSSRKSIIF